MSFEWNFWNTNWRVFKSTSVNSLYEPICEVKEEFFREYSILPIILKVREVKAQALKSSTNFSQAFKEKNQANKHSTQNTSLGLHKVFIFKLFYSCIHCDCILFSFKFLEVRNLDESKPWVRHCIGLIGDPRIKSIVVDC